MGRAARGGAAEALRTPRTKAHGLVRDLTSAHQPRAVTFIFHPSLRASIARIFYIAKCANRRRPGPQGDFRRIGALLSAKW